MVKYIEFGEYNKNYNFIFLAVLFWILLAYLPKFLIKIFQKNNKISDKVNDLYRHENIINSFLLLSMLVFSCIVYLYESKISKNKSNADKLNNSISDKGCYNDIRKSEAKKEQILNNRKNILSILLIICLCIILQFLAGIILALKIFSNWMVILLITSFINTKLFNIEIHKHQKCAIAFNFLVLFIFDLSSFIISMSSDNDIKIYKKYIWLIPIGLLIYSLNVIAFSYAYCKLKWFMELNWISFSKLLINYSLVGFLINIIICIIFSFIKCENENIFCDKEEEGKEGTYYYSENFMIFFEDFLEIYRDENKADLIFLICLFIFNSIILFLYHFYFLLILKNLYPEYYFFTGPIRETIINIIYLFNNKIFQGYFFSEDEEEYKTSLIKFILDIIGNTLIIVGFLIYLEIIELNFYGLNYNLRKNIRNRSEEDIQKIIDDQDESLIEYNSLNKE